MSYSLVFTELFQDGAKKLKKSEPSAYKKMIKFLTELETHPREGTGHPEQLKHYQTETWSRKVSKKHRLVYEIHDDTILVVVLSTLGHYDDK